MIQINLVQDASRECIKIDYKLVKTGTDTMYAFSLLPPSTQNCLTLVKDTIDLMCVVLRPRLRRNTSLNASPSNSLSFPQDIYITKGCRRKSGKNRHLFNFASWSIFKTCKKHSRNELALKSKGKEESSQYQQ